MLVKINFNLREYSPILDKYLRNRCDWLFRPYQAIIKVADINLYNDDRGIETISIDVIASPIGLIHVHAQGENIGKLIDDLLDELKSRLRSGFGPKDLYYQFRFKKAPVIKLPVRQAQTMTTAEA